MMETRRRNERQVLTLYWLTDLLIFFLALSLVSLTRLETLHQIDFVLLQRDRLVCTFLFLSASVLAGSYKPIRMTDQFDATYYTLVALGVTAVAELALMALLPEGARVISRRELVLGIIAASLLVPAWRLFAAGFVSRFEPLHRFFYVLGSETEGKRIAQEINRSPIRAEAAYLSLEGFKARQEKLEARHGPGQAPREDAIISLEAQDEPELMELLEYCEEHCRRTFLHPSLYDTLLLSHGNLHAIAGIPLLEVGNPQTFPYALLKRAMDCVAASVGLVLALPVCLVTALAIKATSPGSILYSQERLGRYGRTFRLYKFRSMVSDAEAKTGPVWAKSNDDRITPVGRFIRNHRIDEIPQLYNVLKGDMSLIGPRPERPHFHKEFSKEWPLFDKRLVVRPGVTSLSHVLGSYSSEPGDRLRYDLIYISSISLFTDLKILVGTIRIVLGAKGAQ